MSDFEGVVPSIATPMDENGQFNEEVFRLIINIIFLKEKQCQSSNYKKMA